MHVTKSTEGIDSPGFLSGGGEMGQRIREFDWESTALGSPDHWPPSLRTLLSTLLHSKFPMFLWWGADLVCFYNDAYRPSLGQNGKHPFILGQKAELAWPEIWDVIKPLIEQVLTGGGATWSEDQLIPIYRNENMEDVYWTFSYSPAKDETGKSVGVLVICTETTEKVNTLLEIKESEEQLAFAIEAAGLGTWDYNPVTRRFAANDRLKEWFGLRSEKEIDLSLALESIVEKDQQRVSQAIHEALQYSSGGYYDIEYTLVSKLTGKKRIVRAKGMAKFNDDQQPLRLNGTLQDITDQVIARDKLQESESRFRTLAETLPQLVWMTDEKGQQLYASSRWKEYSGIEPTGAETWEQIIHPDDLVQIGKEWMNSLENGVVYRAEARLKNAAGAYRWHFVQGEPIRNEKGVIVKWIGSFTEIHHQKESEQQLEALVAKRTADLARSNEDLERFAHVASHDLKEPVRKIKLFSSRLQEEMEEVLPERGQIYLDKIQIAAGRMVKMIEGVLAYSSSDQSPELIEKVNLQEVVGDIITDLDMLIQEKRAQIYYQDLPTFEGATVLIYQLFYNLINNSLKFVQPGVLPEVSITSEPVAIGNKKYYSIQVSDNGIGFKQEYAEKIFESFARLHPKDRYEGTGLGLALCKKIVQRHQGMIGATSELNKGALFEVLLPVSQGKQSI